MIPKKTFLFRPAVLTLLAVSSLTACSTGGYRCPLDPGKTPESPTACAGMHDALAGAKRGAGSKTSVLLDSQGRLIPQGLQENKPAVPLDVAVPSMAEPFRTASGDPVYDPGRKFQVWTRAFVDADGNLHEGHHAWFATPDRWSYGTLRNTETADDSGLMRPALPGTRPAGAKASTDRQQPVPAQSSVPAPTQKDTDKAAMQNLSSMASSMSSHTATPGNTTASGVTVPGVMLGN